MILVIAEKPSVAQSIAKVLGATSRKDGYMEGGNYIVSWCFGHLVELADASSYDERYAKWRYDDLPIVPENWMFEVTKDKSQQFKVLSTLMKDKRVTELVCATDAGREGELIFRLVYKRLEETRRTGSDLAEKKFSDFQLLGGFGDNAALRKDYQNMQRNYVFLEEDVLSFDYVVEQWKKLREILFALA